MTAGGRLFNVVVESAEVGSQLLKGPMKQRVTLIPLNKIAARTVTPAVVAKVGRSVGPSWCECWGECWRW